jgi:hypothetical protein
LLAYFTTLYISALDSAEKQDDGWIGNDFERRNRGVIKVLTRNFPGGNMKIHETLK